ncbi:MAG: mechanosensitive ion channel [Rhodospirillales bacterium]|nr:mechanosensitive ion channel [Rhodospirillales bacterium]MBO6786992.1 mechanosensitive ion channel [Rhodospirillales bacterium]
MEKEMQAVADQIIEIVTVYGLDVVGALTILIVGWIAAGWVRKMVDRGLGRVPNMDSTLRPFLSNIVRWTILAFVIVAVLNQFGVETTSIIAVLGAAGLAIGLALQGTLSNVAAGVMLLILRPFKVGDFVAAGSLSGTVVEIGLFTSELKTADGIYIMAPNSQIWNQVITNYGRNPTRRIDIQVGIAYDDDIDVAQKALQELMENNDLILKDPAPMTMVMALADSSVNINMRCWTNTADYWNALWALNKGAKAAVEDAGCSIPFPQRDVHLFNETLG